MADRDHDLNPRAAGRRRVDAARERARAKAAPDQPARPADDPRLAAAAEEAGRRWGEFLAALAARRPGDTFAVKARFPHPGGVEVLWVAVDRADPAAAAGRLDADPAAAPGLRAGDPVMVARADVADWLAVVAGRLHGGFTLGPALDSGRPAEDAA